MSAPSTASAGSVVAVIVLGQARAPAGSPSLRAGVDLVDHLGASAPHRAPSCRRRPGSRRTPCPSCRCRRPLRVVIAGVPPSGWRGCPVGRGRPCLRRVEALGGRGLAAQLLEQPGDGAMMRSVASRSTTGRAGGRRGRDRSTGGPASTCIVLRGKSRSCLAVRREDLLRAPLRHGDERAPGGQRDPRGAGLADHRPQVGIAGQGALGEDRRRTCPPRPPSTAARKASAACPVFR